MNRERREEALTEKGVSFCIERKKEVIEDKSVKSSTNHESGLVESESEKLKKTLIHYYY